MDVALVPAELGSVLALLGRELDRPVRALRAAAAPAPPARVPDGPPRPTPAAPPEADPLAAIGGLCDELLELTANTLDLAALERAALGPEPGPGPDAPDRRALVEALRDRLANRPDARAVHLAGPPDEPLPADAAWCLRLLELAAAAALDQQPAPLGADARLILDLTPQGLPTSPAPERPTELESEADRRRALRHALEDRLGLTAAVRLEPA